MHAYNSSIRKAEVKDHEFDTNLGYKVSTCLKIPDEEEGGGSGVGEAQEGEGEGRKEDGKRKKQKEGGRCR